MYLGLGFSSLIAFKIVVATSDGGVPNSAIIFIPMITFSVISLYGESGFGSAIFIDEKKFVLITPGSIMMVFTPNCPNSYLNDSDNPSNANFELMYAGDPGKPILPATELTFTIIPDPCFRIMGAVSWISLTIPNKFVSNCCFKSAIEISSRHPNKP